VLEAVPENSDSEGECHLKYLIQFIKRTDMVIYHFWPASIEMKLAVHTKAMRDLRRLGIDDFVPCFIAKSCSHVSDG